jgi:hypothetical protein
MNSLRFHLGKLVVSVAELWLTLNRYHYLPFESREKSTVRLMVVPFPRSV